MDKRTWTGLLGSEEPQGYLGTLWGHWGPSAGNKATKNNIKLLKMPKELSQGCPEIAPSYSRMPEIAPRLPQGIVPRLPRDFPKVV